MYCRSSRIGQQVCDACGANSSLVLIISDERSSTAGAEKLLGSTMAMARLVSVTRKANCLFFKIFDSALAKSVSAHRNANGYLDKSQFAIQRIDQSKGN